MDGEPADPGYGDPLAPVGTPEWAKRWRLEFQNLTKSLPQAPGRALKFYSLGEEYRAWTLLTDGEKPPRYFATFDDFCACPQPWGLEMNPAKFRAYLEAEVGKRDADLITVPPGDDAGGRPKKGEETGATVAPVNGQSDRKQKNLRAILRAPEIVQEMYREGLINQTDAAKMGPKSPTPEQAARIAEARQELEGLDRTQAKPKFRKEAKAVVMRAFGRSDPTPFDSLVVAWIKAPHADREAFLAWIDPPQ